MEGLHCLGEQWGDDQGTHQTEVLVDYLRLAHFWLQFRVDPAENTINILTAKAHTPIEA